MDEHLREHLERLRPRLQDMIRQGDDLRSALLADPGSTSAQQATRAWQGECGSVVNELSGGSKAHWLSRSFTQAFLARPTGGNVPETTPPAEIVGRLLGVLGQALDSLALVGAGGAAPTEPTPPRRFDFVENRELRPVLERAYPEAARALEESRFEEAFLTACGILEAIVTDALEARGPLRNPAEPVHAWSFEKRLSAAEEAGLIRGGWTRLSPNALAYRERDKAHPPGSATEADARQARQVLNVVLRDLDPGR
jgi:hypothetical protein